METIMDNNWYGKRYSLSDIFIPTRKIRLNREWLCVQNRNRDSFYILPTCVVKRGKRVYNGREIVYALNSSVLRENWLIID